MDLRWQHALAMSRRHFLQAGPLGLGGVGLAMLDAARAGAAPQAEVNPLAPKKPHYEPKAKNVIYLHMAGAPPHLDMFDYKPDLLKHTGEDCPADLIKGKRFAFTSGTPKLLGTPQKFAQHGQSGAWISEAMPRLPEVADELTFIKSMFTDQFNHAPAELLLFSGSPQFGRPSLARGSPTASAAKARTCLASSSSSPAAPIPAPATRCGAAASCRRSSRVSSAARRASRCSTSPTPKAWTARCGGSASTPCAT